ncbi:MAG: hypothetical protein D3924_15275 [Candidatus Electrothrix sp. AR4]|nr:hypothetical protein [Candidatus Electrothrix sp. AR4]
MSQESAQSSVAAATGTDVNFKCQVVACLTGFHLNASLLAMESAQKIEGYIKECQQGEIPTCQRNYISYSASSIISAVAALESNINEILLFYVKVPHNNSDEKCDDYHPDKLIIEIFERQLPVIKKYNIISCSLAGEPIPEREQQDIMLLIKIRNLLIHYSPEIEKELKSNSKLNKLINQIKNKRKFPYSPLFNDTKYPFFPHRIICAPTAEWAYNTVNEFIEIYKKRLNLND